MSLGLIHTNDYQLISPELICKIKSSVSNHDQALVFLPSHSQALSAKKALADAGLGLGVDCVEFQSWCQLAWKTYGDSRRIISSELTYIFMEDVISKAQANAGQTLGVNPGTIRLAAKLATSCLGSVSEFEESLSDEQKARLSQGDLNLISVLEAYKEYIFNKGYIQPCQVCVEVARNMVARTDMPPIYVLGYSSMDKAMQKAISIFAASGEVYVAEPWGIGPRFAQIKLLEEELIEGLDEKTRYEVGPLNTNTSSCQSQELAALQDKIFCALDKDELIASQGDVDMLMPSGPLAESELLADQVLEFADQGYSSIGLITTDTEKNFQALSHKLQTRDISVSAQVSVNIIQTPAGRALWEFYQCVSELLDAHEQKGSIDELCDMSWWPPRRLIDFMLSAMSGMTYEKVWGLDNQWRGNRLLLPADVLKQLRKSSKTSLCIAGFIDEMQRGRISCAFTQIKKHIMTKMGTDNPDLSIYLIQALGAVEVFETCATALQQAGIVPLCSKSQAKSKMGFVDISWKVFELVSHKTQSIRPALEVGDSKAHLTILSSQAAAQLSDAQFDALIVCDMDTVHRPVAIKDNAYEAIKSLIEKREMADPLAKMRFEFGKILSLSRNHITFEYLKCNEDTKPYYPSVMLTEALCVYNTEGLGKNELAVPVRTRGEDLLMENIGDKGVKVEPRLWDSPGYAGQISSSNRELICVPRDGVPELPEGRPTLSASQIESYLECPYKWFSLRRMGLDDNDARFSPLETGSFVHRVLELTHRQLLCESLDVSDDELDEALGEIDLRDRFEGSSVTKDNLEHAQQILKEKFALHLENQYKVGTTKRTQALIPHTQAQKIQLKKIEDEMLSCLSWQTDHYDVYNSFQPRLFEKRFGGKRGMPVVYAGADFVGSIDRIDIDSQGNALIIDYKHKKFNTSGEYALFSKEDNRLDFVMPRHVQSLIYAQVLRRSMPHIKPAGAIYLSTKDPHCISGAVKSTFIDKIWGEDHNKSADLCALSDQSSLKFEDLLDMTEERIAEAIKNMVAGDVQARPRDEKACSWCPVKLCERRIK